MRAWFASLVLIFAWSLPVFALEPDDTIGHWAKASVRDRLAFSLLTAKVLIARGVYRGSMTDLKLGAYLARCINSAAGAPDGEFETVPRNPETSPMVLLGAMQTCALFAEKDG